MDVDNPIVVIAGAGSGKTHQMIIEIIKIIPILKKYPEKFCVVITYTNSATEEIKDRLSKIIDIPHNLHISTTHSFLTKFIIEPYAHLFGYLPIDKNYIDKIILPFKVNNHFIAKALCIKKANELSSEKGLIIYDKILEASSLIINNEEVNRQVSNRLAYIFVDEYQDMRLYQHSIFQSILSQRRTNFYCIGDPMQSIFGFAYLHSQLKNEPKPKKFNETPILNLQKDERFDKRQININNRSSKKIVDLINNYNHVIGYSQTLPEGKGCNKIPVNFIWGKDKNEILDKYEQIIKKYNVLKENNKMFSLLIAERWNLFDDIDKITSINNEYGTTKTLFNECSRIVLGALGINKTSFLEILPFNDKHEKYLRYRQFCFSILKDIRNPQIKVDSKYIIDRFNNSFGIKFKDQDNHNIDISKSIIKLKIISKEEQNDRFCSSIHTSKGLEATSVLVIANTNKELLKWLDFDKVIHDSDDDYRLGYVAFSRARELLCITCLQKPNEELIKLLTKLEIEIN
ncbi:putative ATP-dependent DNA helicase YjcD [compost metagenome]